MIGKEHDDEMKAKANYEDNNKRARLAILIFSDQIEHLPTAFEMWSFLNEYFLGNETDRIATMLEKLIHTSDNFTTGSALVGTLINIQHDLNIEEDRCREGAPLFPNSSLEWRI